MKAAIIVNLSKEKAVSCAAQIASLLHDNGASVAMPADCREKLFFSYITYYFTHQQLFSHCDIAITVGGDGTIIHAAKHAA